MLRSDKSVSSSAPADAFDEAVVVDHPRRPASPPAKTSLALVGNFAPRKCGIATFTTDVFEQLGVHRPDIETSVYALDEADSTVRHDPQAVKSLIDRHDPASYAAAAKAINAAGTQAVWLQHEYGIFGGTDGELVCDFVDALAAPLILTPHTVLAEPSPSQRRILTHLIRRASRIMVMSYHARDLLAEIYHAPHEILEVIEHGAPDRPFGRQAQFKRQLGLEGHTVLTTFGLLGPGKGLEQVIEALPAIVARHPDVIYRIVGATHPNLVASHGEAYRDGLKALAEKLGVADNIAWDDRFLDTPELLDQLEACDIYITPYPNLQQSTSGTLSYAVALGKAVISTPYLHARELLGNGIGAMIEPDNAAALSSTVNRLLDDPEEMRALQQRAYAKGRETIWPRFAEAAAQLVQTAVADKSNTCAPPITARAPALDAVLAMSDATGILQHSIGIVPDRRHGYCLDDNARALMLMHAASGLDPAARHNWTLRYASFVQHAWNEDKRAFRNFMRFDRTWCEDEGSEDSNGRALWALGVTAARAPDPQVREWGWRWYDTALSTCCDSGSPRALAFTMLGASAALAARPDHGATRECLEHGVKVLTHLLDASRRPDWAWFEAVLAYDNPRLPQALIEAGRALNDDAAVAAGLESLRWIAAQQTAASGHFRPIGSESFGRAHDSLPFDQQPLEAQAAIEAAASAYAVGGDRFWIEHADAAWRWFFGANDRGAVLGDLATGICRDGIGPRGANENCGAESVLAFHLSYYSMIAFSRAEGRNGAGESVGSEVAEPVRAY